MQAHSFSLKSIDGVETPLKNYAGRWLLVVNVASKCGLTPQYTGLEKLARKYRARGLDVLGVPCNQFAGQEPGTEAEIKDFCSTNYDISFPLFAKVEVNGAAAHPLFRGLASTLPGPAFTEEAIKTDRMAGFLAAKFPDFMKPDALRWNFTKFLIGPDGTPVKRYEPSVTPEQIDADLEQRLAAK
jgi:glutathione peroxidase